MRGSAAASPKTVPGTVSVPAAPTPSLTAPITAPPPNLASGVEESFRTTTSHGDDSFCALCRRCQMRKKLERRLAARRVPEGTAGSPEQQLSGDDAPQRDERSITELLDYIGERAVTQGARGGRRARRKRAAAMRRRALACPDGVDGESRKGRISRDGAVVARAERGDSTSGDGGCGGSHGSQASGESHASHDEDDDEGEDGRCEDVEEAEKYVLFASGQSAIESREREFTDPVDREVEEFRRVLEAAHANSGSRTPLAHGATR